MGRAVRKSENAKGVPMLFAEPRRATRMANMGDYADMDAENVESAEGVCPRWRIFCMVCLRSLRNCSVSSLRARWCWAAATSTFSTRRRAITAMIARKSSDVRGSWCAAAERRRTLISRNRFCVKRDGGSCVLTLLVKRRSHRFRRLRSM